MDLNLAERIKRARIAAGRTQADVARALGISRAAVVHWESGANAPRPERLNQFFEYLSAGPSRNDERMDGATSTLPGSRVDKGLVLPIRGTSLDEIMSDTWRKDKISVFLCRPPPSEAVDMLIERRVSRHMRMPGRVGTVSCAIEIAGFEVPSTFEAGEIAFLRPDRMLSASDLVLVVGSQDHDARTARAGTIAAVSAQSIHLSRPGGQIDTIPTSDYDAILHIERADE